LSNTQTDCTGGNNRNTQHKAEKTQKKLLAVEEEAESAGDGGAWKTRVVIDPTQP
jgi:hypothetical protein